MDYDFYYYSQIDNYENMEYKKTDWQNYRKLQKGEIIRETDELLEDGKGWRKAIYSVGTPAPDPQFTSHRWYRRLKNDN